MKRATNRKDKEKRGFFSIYEKDCLQEFILCSNMAIDRLVFQYMNINPLKGESNLS